MKNFALCLLLLCAACGDGVKTHNETSKVTGTIISITPETVNDDAALAGFIFRGPLGAVVAGAALASGCTIRANTGQYIVTAKRSEAVCNSAKIGGKIIFTQVAHVRDDNKTILDVVFY